MAGVVPFSSCTPGRKQWNIRDKRSVRRLRSQLAEDGCPESQLVLAKQLLQEKSMMNTSDNEENARLGVFWLIKASEQGNVEATDILKECLATGEGITEHNYVDVKTCLSMSQNEKLARRAAREMFLSMSAGQDFITSEQLRRRMNKVTMYGSPSTSRGVRKRDVVADGKLGKPCLEADGGEGDRELAANEDDSDEEAPPSDPAGWAARGDIFGEKLTEDHLERAASTYSRGEMPLVQRVLTLTDPHARGMQNLNYLQRTLLHPWITLQNAYLKILETFGSPYRHPTFRLLPTYNQIQILILFALFPFINIENIILFVPMCLYYGSFFTMVVSTLQMLQSKKDYRHFRVWSRLFLSYDRGGHLNTEDAEFEYCKNNLRPFGWFFLSLLVNLMVYPLVSEFWIPESEFAVISLSLTFVTLISFHQGMKLDVLLLLSFGVNVLAKYPYESDGVVRQTWRFLDLELPTLQSYGLPCFASHVVGNGVEFCLNFRGVFYLLIPGIFVKLAHRDKWKGTYKVLIPHCVTLAWWQVAVLCSQGATFYGLLRSTLALVGLILFLPLAGLATLLLPAIAVLKHLTDAALTPKTGLTTLLAFIPLLLGYALDKRRGVRIGTYISKVQILLAVVSALVLVCPNVQDLLATSPQPEDMAVPLTLTWDQYSSLCHPAGSDQPQEAVRQMDCLHLARLPVNWEGSVHYVRVVNIHNNIAKITDNLPESLRNKIACWYGEPYPDSCSGGADGDNLLCTTLKQLGQRSKCHLHNWNRYDFEIGMKIRTSRWNGVESDIRVAADDSLRNLTLALHPGDQIWLAGLLDHPETLGTARLKVTAEELGCIQCRQQGLTSLKRSRDKLLNGHTALREAFNGLKRVLNFLLSPVVVFR